MSKCKLRIELDRPDACYQVGDTVNCTVHVSISKSTECKALTLKHYWRTHGRGNRDSGNEQETTLFTGEWVAGEYQYPYSFVIPDGPLTYHGKLINVDWYLKAQADIPWAFDPKEEIEFIVERKEHVEDELEIGSIDNQDPDTFYAAPKSPYAQLKKDGKNDALVDELQKSYSNTKVPDFFSKVPNWVAFILLAISVGAGYFAYAGFKDADYELMIFGGLICLFTLVAAYKLLQNSIAEQKVGEVKMTIQPTSLKPDAYCNIGLAFTVQDNVDLAYISATLTGEEIAVSGSGTNRSTHSHTFYKKEISTQRNSTLTVGRRFSEKLQVPIPSNAAASFSSSDNTIKWQIKVTIAIKKWPDWHTTESIVVLI